MKVEEHPIVSMLGEPITAAKGVGGPSKKISRGELEKMRVDANQPVRGVFRCHEPRGGSVTFAWREYKGDPIRRWTLKDGLEYQIPKGLAKHINKNCYYAVHTNILDKNGNPMKDLEGNKVSRMNFESLEFYH